MKKILIKLMFVTGILFLVQACSDDFLEINPNHAVNESAVFTTTENAWGAVNGIHRLLYQQGGDMDQAGQMAMRIHNDAMGDDLVHGVFNWFTRSMRWQEHINENSGNVRHRYRFYYQIIFNANMILKYTDAAVGPDEQKNWIKGQALAYRAWAHFELVQFYAPRYDWTVANNDQRGIPLLLEPTPEPQPQATVEQVYTQIMTDLDDAITLLAGYNRPAKSHINISVARGIRARVALATGKWDVAIENAQLARTGFPLMTADELMGGFNSATTRAAMWASTVIPDHTSYFHSFFAFLSFNFNATDIRSNPKAVNSSLYTMIPATDVRKGWFEPTAAAARARLTANQIPTTFGAIAFHAFKFRAVDISDSRGDMIWMRTEEMMLIEAEALARKGGNDAAAAQVLFDLVKTRNTAYALSTNTGQDLINEIMIQRRIELWGEGFRWQDLKRTNANLDRRGTNFNVSIVWEDFIPAGDPRWVSLFPKDELNANSLIIQNQH